MQSSEEKFNLKEAPKLVRYASVVNRIAFLSKMFLQSNAAKTDEEKEMLKKLYLDEAKDSNFNQQGLIHSFYSLSQLITGKTVLGGMFGDFYGSQEDSVLNLDISLCNTEKLKILFRLICSLILQMKNVYGEDVDFLDDFLQKSGIEQCSSVHSVCRPIR